MNRDIKLAKYTRVAGVNPHGLAERPPCLLNVDSVGRARFVSPHDYKNRVWCGINEHGLVVALTNAYRLPTGQGPANIALRVSFLEALLSRCRDPGEVIEILADQRDGDGVPPVNVFCATRTRAHVYQYCQLDYPSSLLATLGEPLGHFSQCTDLRPRDIPFLGRKLAPGPFFLANYYYPSLTALNEQGVVPEIPEIQAAVKRDHDWLRQDTTIRHARATKLLPWDGPTTTKPREEILDRVNKVATDHGGAFTRGISICRHERECFAWETRRTTSNTTILLPRDESRAGVLYYCAGKPCSTPWRDFSEHLGLFASV